MNTFHPLALSLSKPVLSDCAKQTVEGGRAYFEPRQEVEEQGFDKLSPSGVGL